MNSNPPLGDIFKKYNIDKFNSFFSLIQNSINTQDKLWNVLYSDQFPNSKAKDLEGLLSYFSTKKNAFVVANFALAY